MNPTPGSPADELLTNAALEEYNGACEARRPSMVLRPRLSIDGDMWCALFGENIQDGVAGFGASPELAYLDFDKQWCARLPARGGRTA